MKTTNIIFWALGAVFVLSCSKDNGPPKEMELQNEPPSGFDLIGVTNGAVGVDVKPTFSWKAAIDPDGDEQI